MNLYEATNYFLEEDRSDNGVIKAFIKKILSMVKLPSGDALKQWIKDHAEEFDRANNLYTKAVVMRESVMNEGIFDLLKGVNKNTLIMAVLIAMSAVSGAKADTWSDLDKEFDNIMSISTTITPPTQKDIGDKASNTVKELENEASKVVKDVKVVRVEPGTPGTGFTVNYTGPGGNKHFKQILGGIDKEAVQKFKDLAAEKDVDPQTAVNILHYTITNNILKSGSVKEKLDGLSGGEFAKLVKGTIK